MGVIKQPSRRLSVANTIDSSSHRATERRPDYLRSDGCHAAIVRADLRSGAGRPERALLLEGRAAHRFRQRLIIELPTYSRKIPARQRICLENIQQIG